MLTFLIITSHTKSLSIRRDTLQIVHGSRRSTREALNPINRVCCTVVVRLLLGVAWHEIFRKIGGISVRRSFLQKYIYIFSLQTVMLHSESGNTATYNWRSTHTGYYSTIYDYGSILSKAWDRMDHHFDVRQPLWLDSTGRRGVSCTGTLICMVVE